MQVQPIGKWLLWPAVFTLVVGAILVSLGVWQLHRLAWKEALIAEIAARAEAPPVPLPPEALWPLLDPEDYDYRHVEAVGHYEHDKEALSSVAPARMGWDPAISCSRLCASIPALM